MVVRDTIQKEIQLAKYYVLLHIISAIIAEFRLVQIIALITTILDFTLGLIVIKTHHTFLNT